MPFIAKLFIGGILVYSGFCGAAENTVITGFSKPELIMLNQKTARISADGKTLYVDTFVNGDT